MHNKIKKNKAFAIQTSNPHYCSQLITITYHMGKLKLNSTRGSKDS